MSSQSDYTLWLMPTDRQAKVLRAFISRLAQRYQTPIFDPHITLASVTTANATPNEVIKIARQMASKIKPFTLHYDGLADSERYFRCVYARVTPSPSLFALRKMCVRLWGESETYEPHISLIYGELIKNQREECMRCIKIWGIPDALASIEICKMQIVHLAERPQDWLTVEEIELKKDA